MSLPAWFANGVLREIARQLSCYIKTLPPSVTAIKPLLYVFIFSQIINTSLKAGQSLKEVGQGTIKNYFLVWSFLIKGAKDISITNLVIQNSTCYLEIISDNQFQNLLTRQFGSNPNPQVTVIINPNLRSGPNLICSASSIGDLTGYRNGNTGLFEVKVSSTRTEFTQGIIQVSFIPKSQASTTKTISLKFG